MIKHELRAKSVEYCLKEEILFVLRSRLRGNSAFTLNHTNRRMKNVPLLEVSRLASRTTKLQAKRKGSSNGIRGLAVRKYFCNLPAFDVTFPHLKSSSGRSRGEERQKIIEALQTSLVDASALVPHLPNNH